MSFAQMKMITHDTNVTPNQGVERRQPGRADGRQADPCRGRGREERAAQARRRRTSASPVGEPHGRRRASSRAAARPSPTAQLIGDKLFNTHDHRLLGRRQRDHAGAGRRGLAGHEAGQPVQDRRHQPAARWTSRTRSRASTPTSTTSGSRACSTAASCGLAARAPTATARRRRSSRSTRARSSTSRARRSSASANFLGVVAPTEYAAIQAAAQLKVKWADPPVLPGVGNLWKGMRDHDSAGQGAGARSRSTAATSTPRSSRPRSQVNQTYKFHYTGPPADRPVVLRRRRDAERRPRSSRTPRTRTARGRTSRTCSTR